MIAPGPPEQTTASASPSSVAKSLGGRNGDALVGPVDGARGAVLHDEPRHRVARAPRARSSPMRRSNRWWSVPTVTKHERRESERRRISTPVPATTVSRYRRSCSGHCTRKSSVTGWHSRPVIVAESMRS